MNSPQPAAADPTALVTVHPGPDRHAHVTVNGHPAPRPVPVADLGAMLSALLDRANAPIHVQIHEPDGTIHADTLTPRPHPTAGHNNPEPGPAVGMSVPGPFLPGEELLVARITRSATADQHGAPPPVGPPRLLRRRRLVLCGTRSRSWTHPLRP